MFKRLSPETWIALLFAVVLSCIKKWEVGGNLDTIWYSAIGRNIAQNGDYFHFFISEKMPQIRDHMPLTYWVTGAVMSLFGTTDFVARLYPMLASVASTILVYLIGRRYRDNTAGLIAILVYALSIGSTKWNGSLLHDVPLTTYFLISVYAFLRGRDGEKNFYLLMGLGLFLGVMTKGPIIGGFALGYVVYALIAREGKVLRDARFWLGIALFFALCAVMFIPQLRFDGDNVFVYFYKIKSGYLEAAPPSWSNRLAYFKVLWESAFVPVLLIVAGLLMKLKPWLENKRTGEDSLLFICIALGTMLPLSYFQVKFPHYLLPVYPFVALAAAPVLDHLLRKKREKIPQVVGGVSCAAVLFFAIFPVKITGGREKHEINMANFVKLIKGANFVHYMGRYEDDYALLQTFKFYGNIDLQPITRDVAEKLDLNEGPIILQREKLPLRRAAGDLTEKDCVFLSKAYCVIADRSTLQLHVPNNGLPHELMSRKQLSNLDEDP